MEWTFASSGAPSQRNGGCDSTEGTNFLSPSARFPTLIAYRQEDEASPVSFNLAEGRGEEHLWDSIFGIIYNNKFSLLYAYFGPPFIPFFKARVKDIFLPPVEVNISRRIVIRKVKNVDILGRSIPAFMLLYESTHSHLFPLQCRFLLEWTLRGKFSWKRRLSISATWNIINSKAGRSRGRETSI